MGKKIYTSDDIKIVNPKNNQSHKVDISQVGFERSLVEAARCALEFARQLVINNLPDKIRYDVILGCSYDGNSLEQGEYTFPEDYDNGQRLFENREDVVGLLWKDGKVPEWVNVSVESEDGVFTNVKLECCGRYSSNVEHVYHAHEGRAPFHVVGPPMPPEVESREHTQKYDLYWNKNK